MEEGIEVSAKSVDEAIELAMARLGLDRSQVQIEVLSQGKSGILGFGAEDARVRVTPLSQPSPAQLAQEVVENILRGLKLQAQVQAASESGEPPVLNIEGQDMGILIGRWGETLNALQYLVNLVVSRKIKARAGVVIDVEGYRERRSEALRALAQNAAERVKASGRSMVLEPMLAHERRIVHMALSQDPDISTRSLGEEGDRRVVVFLKKGLLTEEP